MKSFLFFCCFLIVGKVLLAAPDIDSSFKETPLTLTTASGNIEGTLLLPDAKGKVPLVLMIAGSGPTDRDGNNPYAKNESLKKLAYGMAAANIASVRYDKRGIAGSKSAAKSEADLRFDDYIADAAAWVQLLKKDARFSTVWVLGHSEGSLIGMIAADKADGFISVAGAGRPADELLKEQLSAQPQPIQDASFPIIDSLKMGQQAKAVSPLLFSLFRPSVQPYLISWFKYNPQTEIQKLTVPVLIVQGTTDLQVTEKDAQLLAAAQPKAQLKIIPGMNHVLRTVTGDKKANAQTYNDASLPLTPALVDTINLFIQQQSKGF